MHPLAFNSRPSGGNSGGWNEVHSGDRIISLIDGRTGILDECLHSGEALITWDDGTFGEVKYHHIAPRDKVRVIGDRWEAILEPRS